jgi:lipoprotein-releasing system permease protein
MMSSFLGLSRRTFILGAVLAAGAAGLHAGLRAMGPEAGYYAQAALVLLGVLLVVVAGFAVASFAAVRLAERLLRRRLQGAYTLFVGWNMLRSQRTSVPLVQKLRAALHPAAASVPKRLGRAAAHLALACGAAAAAWFAWLTAPRGPGLLAFAHEWAAVFTAAAALWLALRALGLILLPPPAPGTRNQVRSRAAVTVPNFISMVGVGIGVWALILVLSVMSGFQSDLRQKILDTNAHVLIQARGGFGGLDNPWGTLAGVRSTKGVESADAYVEAEAMIASPFNSSVKLAVRGVSLHGPKAERLRAAMVDGSLDWLERPELFASDRAWSMAGAPLPPRALPQDRAPADPGIEMPPIPGGAPQPTEGAVEIEMPAIPGGAPREELAHNELRHGLLLEQLTADTLGVSVGQSLEASVFANEPQPSGPTLVPFVVRGVYRRSPTDADRPEAYGAASALAPLLHDRSSALVVLHNEAKGRKTSAKLAVLRPESPDVAALGADMVLGAIADLVAPPSADLEPLTAIALEDAGASDIDLGLPATRVHPALVLGSELADSLRARVGDSVRLISLEAGVGPMGVQPKAGTFVVAGVFRTGTYDFDAKFAYSTTPDAQRFFELGHDINRIEVRLDDPSEPSMIRAQLEAIVGPGAEVLDWIVLNRNLFSALKLEKIVMFLVLGLIIAVASFNIVASLAMLIQEKSREIAVLRAMGGTPAEIRKTFFAIGTFVGVIGAATGTTLGLGSCLALEWAGVPLPPEYFIPTVPVEVHVWEVAAAAAAALAISLLATIWPATAAARLRPVEGLRYD